MIRSPRRRAALFAASTLAVAAVGVTVATPAYAAEAAASPAIHHLSMQAPAYAADSWDGPAGKILIAHPVDSGSDLLGGVGDILDNLLYDVSGLLDGLLGGVGQLLDGLL
jgi:hypothetical protein